ncbi:hypothetical protein E8E12_008621 [Didymella heteroderae]|uniref:Derlin n=1 Tax=Didymella heteroderae TaxID=1769908 RepID=A0A9P4WUL4_9PLEO|nr:hypothetical protein E8E12_008621 [Didymella heteroderae]
MDVFWTLPPVSRTITALSVAVSALGYGGIINMYQYIFATQFVFTTKVIPQIWRVFTAFLITKPKFAILLDPYFLYQYGSALERESSRFAQPGDFFVYTMFVGSVIVQSITSDYLPTQLESMAEVVPGTEEEYPCTSHCVLFNGYTFLPALSLAYAYTFAQDNPTRQVNFFIVNFDAKFLPFALLFMTFVIDGQNAALTQVFGLIAAHMYDFLTRIWPTFGGGKNYIFTPQIVKRWFGATPGTAQNRGYGYAVQGRGRETGSNQPSTGRSTGTNFGGMGPGRRLGGE